MAEPVHEEMVRKLIVDVRSQVSIRHSHGKKM